jgi:hypothetical protein
MNYASGLVAQEHQLNVTINERDLSCGAFNDNEIDLVDALNFFVRHPPTPVPRPALLPAKAKKAEKDAWQRAQRRAAEAEKGAIAHDVSRINGEARAKNWGTFTGKYSWSSLPRSWVPVAELKSFLLDTVQEATDRAFVASFPFDDLAEALRRQWNEHVLKAKQDDARAFEERKRKFDTLYVDQDRVEEQRPWKKARKDDDAL